MDDGSAMRGNRARENRKKSVELTEDEMSLKKKKRRREEKKRRGEKKGEGKVERERGVCWEPRQHHIVEEAGTTLTDITRAFLN